MTTYYVNKYESIFDELFEKEKWKKLTKDFYKNKKQETDFLFIHEDSHQYSETKFKNTIKSKFYNKYTRFNLSIDKTNKVEVFSENKTVTIYVLIINSKEIYIYMDGKVYEDKIRFYCDQSYFHFTFQQIKKIIYEKICEFLKRDENSEINDKEENNTSYQIFTADFIINTQHIVKLTNINLEPNLSMEIDKLHKMKIHYWIWYDLLNKFVFKNNKKHRWCLLDDSVKNVDCENLKQKTFLINRSRILKNILLENGWREGNKNELVDFSYWDTFYSRGVRVNSNISLIPKNITNVIDNKLTMYTTLLKNNLTDFLPKTYTKLKDIDPNIFNEDKIFFLKKHNGSGGKDVYAINSLKRMNEIVKKQHSNYILQEEVPDMLLHNGHKTSLRIFVLITGNKNYIYKEGRTYVYSSKYCKNNMSNNVHNDVYNSNFFNFTDQHYYDKAFPKIKDICFKVQQYFFKKNNINDKEYIILGYDFILNNNYKPYLIEVNSYPNLAPCCEIIKTLNTKLLSDFYYLFIEQKFKDVKKNNNISNDWIPFKLNISNYKKETVDVYKNIRKPIGIQIIIEKLTKYFKSEKDIKILDCGSGCGNYSVELYNNGYHNITAIDANINMLNKLNDVNKNIKTLQVDITNKFPFEHQEFDVIIINQVIHHFNDYLENYSKHEKLFEELNRISKKNSILSINTSNLEQHVQGMWWGEFIEENLKKYCKRYCPEEILIKLLANNCFTLNEKKICSEPFIGENYFKMNYIYNTEIRNTDTLWKYVNDNEYNSLISKLQSLKNLDIFFKEKLLILEKIGQSSFYFLNKVQ